jgi:hypothetical protein
MRVFLFCSSADVPAADLRDVPFTDTNVTTTDSRDATAANPRADNNNATAADRRDATAVDCTNGPFTDKVLQLLNVWTIHLLIKMLQLLRPLSH